MGDRSDRASTGITPRERIPEAHRQAVLDAAALLQVRRTETAAALTEGRPVDAEVVESHQIKVAQHLIDEQESWTELLSVRPAATAVQLRASLPNTRALVTGGMRMTSVYDLDGVSPDARLLLAGETLGTYLVSAAPVQMKIVNRSHVLLQGPFHDGAGSVMAVRSQRCLEAAWRYWEAVLQAAFPVTESVTPLPDLTPRQHQVVVLMSTGSGDDAIAAALGVSVRTVRSEVAAIMDALGVQSRFAAGVRLRVWSETDG
jgi:DNA-binding CsgD family transcriptional regulator